MRITAGIMGLMVLVVVLFSSFYIAAEAHHDCCGEDCPVCAGILQCESTLRGIGGGTTLPPLVAAFALLLLPAVFLLFELSQGTPVSRKVRLND